jgi:hypothetical protein
VSSKAKLNYAIDLVIAGAFVLAALSGLVLFFVPSGYQGGRNPHYLQPVLFLTTREWDAVHTWSSLAMIAGVGAHLIVHWNWMLCMTRRLLKQALQSGAQEKTCPLA